MGIDTPFLKLKSIPIKFIEMVFARLRALTRFSPLVTLVTLFDVEMTSARLKKIIAQTAI